ncbi:MAG: FkbM family methyltransferase [Roseobacter sp.]|uniref:FkbM family methyltransferase n=1 Tax=Tateyamaria sp. TaxID=1929288 RepID=UPI00326E1E51
MADFDLNKTKKRVSRDWAVPFTGLNVTATRIHGKRVIFCTDRRNDPIQDRNRGGHFYEQEELDVLIRRFPLGGTFVDIGANTGNHSLFFALFGHASLIIPFEPNPLAYRILLANIALNDLAAVIDVSHIGIGLSDRKESGFGMQERAKNLGGAKMLEGEGSIEVHPADTLLKDCSPSLIKIDVEGMELKVLRGLGETLEYARPEIFVEVDRRNDAGFHEWLSTSGYEVIDVFQRYEANKNYLLTKQAK